MGTLKNIGQKIKGKAQQIKGDVEIAAGHTVRGNIDKLRGKANVLEADVKTKIDNGRV